MKIRQHSTHSIYYYSGIQLMGGQSNTNKRKRDSALSSLNILACSVFFGFFLALLLKVIAKEKVNER